MIEIRLSKVVSDCSGFLKLEISFPCLVQDVNIRSAL